MPALEKLAAMAALALAAQTGAAQNADRDWSLELDVYTVAADANQPSWFAGGAGKLRYDAAHGGIGLARLAGRYTRSLTPTLTAQVVGDYVDDGDSGVDLTEAFLDWRPVPTSPARHRLRAGFFYPEISLENVGPGWSSPYTISFSAISTWLAEEVRTLGVEWRWLRSIGTRASGRRVAVIAGAFGGNDPAGTLLAWKGWSLHDRQTRLRDVLPLPTLPQIAPGMLFEAQAPRAEPFIETDDRPGYYVGARWQIGRRAMVSAMHYDNRAEPTSLRDGQYGWRTEFGHLGLKLELPRGIGLIAQWIGGTTAMGPFMGTAHAVDNAFDAHYLLLTRPFGRHRLSLRRDEFGVDDRDTTPLDDNSESGSALTLAYSYSHSPRISVDLEWVEIDTRRPAWTYAGLSPGQRERSLRAQLSYRFEPGP